LRKKNGSKAASERLKTNSDVERETVEKRLNFAVLAAFLCWGSWGSFVG
jgi:hypothetical protein